MNELKREGKGRDAVNFFSPSGYWPIDSVNSAMQQINGTFFIHLLIG